jgi:ABC-type ATPase with predicted acetyltransferase domain
VTGKKATANLNQIAPKIKDSKIKDSKIKGSLDASSPRLD